MTKIVAKNKGTPTSATRKTKKKTKQNRKNPQKMAPDSITDMHGSSDTCVIAFTLQRLTCQNFMTSELLTFAYCDVYCLTSLENDTDNFQLDRSGNFS